MGKHRDVGAPTWTAFMSTLATNGLILEPPALSKMPTLKKVTATMPDSCCPRRSRTAISSGRRCRGLVKRSISEAAFDSEAASEACAAASSASTLVVPRRNCKAFLASSVLFLVSRKAGVSGASSSASAQTSAAAPHAALSQRQSPATPTA